MMLLMGMWISLTKNPMNPMIPKPIAVAIAILLNSFLETISCRQAGVKIKENIDFIELTGMSSFFHTVLRH